MKNVEFKTRGEYHHHYFSLASVACNSPATPSLRSRRDASGVVRNL